ncbi:MAG: TIGR01212 family radical SAM protein [Peptoclostridium sp.]|uniref:TIGR01212 family radical SAM protein n=1 Tax=Peptoclostridium sp. TaxID=1904860 RepID=UPI00139B718D|nr:TIGR01212 family radical SAM protein [Peptoclostridium sp.]MZQ75483.1 TIGR01212 family radical SAM protein [Peptoclostridium sp.]
MLWNDKRYHTLNFDLRSHFGCKIMKLSVDGGFTCPNRDGTLGNNGCLFCSDSGSGEFAGDRAMPIKNQLAQQIELLHPKWPSGKYIAYFQNFTNTYSSIDDLEEKYETALSFPEVVGLAIATRPDCLGEDVLELLSRINKKTFLWLELGLQTVHEDTAGLIRRGYALEQFEKVFAKLKASGIKIVVHIILGLPGEDRSKMLESVRYVSGLNPYGIKLHLLHILKNSDLFDYYNAHPFNVLSKEEYISLVTDSLEILNPNIVVHRVTGDGSKDTLFSPLWSLNKRSVLNGIDIELKRRDSWQGKCYTG